MAASSTTVDLSQLAPPLIVEQLDFETIVARLVAKMQALLPSFDATVDSDPAVKVLHVAAYEEQLLRRQFQDAALQLLVAYAGGAALDHLAAVFGVSRLVITPADTVTGAPEVDEGDDALRQRIVLAPHSYSVAGPELAYVAHAKAASGDVLDASATSPAPGRVLVSVLSRTGDGTAPAATLAAVDAVVGDRAIRPMGDDVTTASATIVGYEIVAALTTFAGPDVQLILDAAAASLAAYLDANRLLGRNHRRSGIEAALTVANVENVVLTSPAADVLCDLTAAARAISITVTHGGYAS